MGPPFQTDIIQEGKKWALSQQLKLELVLPRNSHHVSKVVRDKLKA